MAFDVSLVTAPFRMQPGLRRIAPGVPQLTPARPGRRHLREKMAVLGAFAHEALVCAPGFDAGAAVQAIAVEAAGISPLAFTVERQPADGTRGAFVSCRAPRLGWSLDERAEVMGQGDAEIGRLLRALPPASRLPALLCLAFEEDFAVIDGVSGVIPWLAVALPSRWAPAEKLGLRFAEVHAPVADNAQLLASAAALTRLVTAGTERWERFVWTITAEPHLHQHPARGRAPWPSHGPEAVAAFASFRSERQTFIPVPAAGQAVFTIHVDSAPLAQAIATPEAAARVHDAVASMSADVLAYRDLAGVREPLLAWLASRAATPAHPAASALAAPSSTAPATGP